MKRYLHFLSISVFALFISACSSPEQSQENTQPEQAQNEETKLTERPEYDFRKARWGMSKEQVMESERAKLIFDNENSVEYRVFIGDFQTQANYTFDNDKLVRVGLYFLTEYEDKNKYIEVYEFLQDGMTKGVGSPVLDKVVQTDPSATIEEGQEGQAVCNGELVYGTQWQYPGSDVQLLLRGEEGKCYLTTIYLMNLPEGFEEQTEPQESAEAQDTQPEKEAGENTESN